MFDNLHFGIHNKKYLEKLLKTPTCLLTYQHCQSDNLIQAFKQTYQGNIETWAYLYVYIWRQNTVKNLRKASKLIIKNITHDVQYNLLQSICDHKCCNTFLEYSTSTPQWAAEQPMCKATKPNPSNISPTNFFLVLYTINPNRHPVPNFSTLKHK